MTQGLFFRSGEAFEGKPLTNASGRPFTKVDRNCPRCGGHGGSDKWGPAGTNTGWTCWDCGGSGKHVNGPATAKLYTRDELDKLNARKAKADAKRAIKRQQAEEVEAARIAANRSQVVEDHAQIIKRIRKLPRHIDFAAKMLSQIIDQARPLTQGQYDALVKILDRTEAEQSRIEKATHVGQIGERVELELTFYRDVLLSDHPVYGQKWVTIARDEQGNTVVYKGRWNGFGFECAWDESLRVQMIKPGSTVKVKATVKEHTDFRGEPQTIVQRPKAA